MTRFLTCEDLLALVGDLGVGPVRDVGLLDSAAHRPSSSLFGADAYPTLALKAAALIESIVRGHALVDGNKRLGWLAFVVFLDINDHALDVDDEAAYEFVIAAASGQLALADMARVIEGWLAERAPRT